MLIVIGWREERNGNERIWMVGMRGEYEVCVREEKKKEKGSRKRMCGVCEFA